MPKSFTSIATALGLALLCAFAVLYADAVPDVIPASAPPTEFSAERAMAHVREIAQRPHPAGSPEHRRVAQYVLAELSRMGLGPELQQTTGVGTRYPSAGRIANVLIHLPGTDSGRIKRQVLLMAHYDGVPAGPAAADDASGVGMLLEVVRALNAGPPLRNDVLVLFTDGEETGLLGAAAFVREHPYATQLGVVMNFEARGTRGPSLMFETGPDNLDVVRALRRVGGAKATSLSTAVYRQLPNDTDLSEIALLGVPALNFGFIHGVERYHTSEDDVAHLDPRSVQDHGEQALALVRLFGSEPLPRARNGDAVFFDVPLLGLLVYPAKWSVALAVVALVLAAVALVRLRRGETRWLRDATLGAVGSVVAVLLAVGVAVAVTEVLRRLHITIGSGTPANSGVYVAGVAALSFAAASAIYAVARLVATPRAAHAGAALVWGVIALIAAIVAPGISFLFVWPALFGASSAIVATMSVAGWVRRLDIWITATVAAFIVVPVLYLTAVVALGLAAVSAALIGALTALIVWLLAPLVDDLAAPWRWAASAGAAIVAVALLAIGMMTVRHDADNPARASLVYAFDADSGTAWLTGSTGAALGREYVQQAVEAARGASSAASPPSWISPGWVRNGIAAVQPAPIVPPSIATVRDTAGEDARVVSLRVRPAPGTLGITMSMDADRVRNVAVDGRVVDRSRYRQSGGRRWTLDYVAPPDSGFILELLLASTAPAEMTLLARSAGLPPLGATLPARPPGVLASQNGDVTIVHKRVRF